MEGARRAATRPRRNSLATGRSGSPAARSGRTSANTRRSCARSRGPPACRSRVTFLGERRDVAALLAAADIHCQPNTAPEPFGLAFVEALHAGVPVVTTDAGGAREIVTPACGILVEPVTRRDCARALQRSDREPSRRRAPRRGRARARARAVRSGAQLARLETVLRGVTPGARHDGDRRRGRITRAPEPSAAPSTRSTRRSRGCSRSAGARRARSRTSAAAPAISGGRCAAASRPASASTPSATTDCRRT